MDLLGGYASSDSDEENEVKQTTTLPKSRVVATKPSSSSKGTLLSQSTKTTTPALKGKKRKGSKILSLASVLPQHILDQLTKATSYDVDSDDDDEYSRSISRPKESTPNAPSQPKRSHEGRDPALTSFLQELQATKSNSAAKTNVGNPEQDNGRVDSALSKKPSTILGAAFMTSTVETTVVKKKGGQVVRDIHGEARKGSKRDERIALSNTSDSSPAKNSTKNHPKMVVETVSADTDDGDSSDSDEEAEGTPIAQPPAPVARTPGAMPSSRPRERTGSSIAPPVVRAAPSTSYTARASSYRQAAPPVSAYDNYRSPQQQQQTRHHQQQQQPKFQSKKAQRKHMEKMLRAGNMSGVTEGDNVIHMQGQGPTDYVPEVQTYQETPSHGVRVVPVSMYGKAGSSDTSSEISGKQRSKHQLNALMASAASLEQQRARAPQGSSSSTSHKVNAKRKYGW